jgi:ribosome recycling factor
MQEIDEVALIFDKLHADLEKSVNYLKTEFAATRAGRANPHILDKVLVNYYGAPTPINQMANISVVDARMLQINLYDQTQLHPMRKALSEANLGVNISDDGNVIRLAFPALTEERRKELAKSLRTSLENAKVAMRSARRDANDDLKALKKDNILNEDEVSYQEKEVQKKLDDYIAKLDSLYTAKEKEIMEI